MPTTARAPRNGRDRLSALGHDRHGDPDEAVGAHLQQDAGEQHRTDGGRRGVRVRQPGVQRPHRRLDREAETHRDEGHDLHATRHVGALAVGELDHVEGAGVGADDEEADEHQHAAQQRVEDEYVGRPPPAPGHRVVTPLRDDEPHRHQHDLEEDEEEQQVEGHEGADHADLEEEQQADQCAQPRSLGADPQQVAHAERGQPAGEQQQWRGDAVDAEVEAQPEGGHPLHVGGGVGGNRPDGDGEGCGGDAEAEAHREALTAARRRDQEQQRPRRREGDEDREQPVVHETRVTTPATRRSTPASSPVK